jgi:hypothetical protein
VGYKSDFGFVSFVSLNAVGKPFGMITVVHLKKKKKKKKRFLMNLGCYF